jgi:glucose/arabinose dehydrogenase
MLPIGVKASVAIRAVAAFLLLNTIAPADGFAQSGVVVVSGLQTPTAFAHHPTDPAVWFVAQQNGVIWLIRNRVPQPTPFLNLAGTIVTGGERGLLGLAFPADYATSRRFYVSFTASGATGYPEGGTVVRRYRRSLANPDVADASTWLDLRWSTNLRYIEQPFANHNGGCIAFGPDGYLYVARGDGGFGGDPGNRAQTPSVLLGKILRINVNVPDSNPDGFVVPVDNPFLDGVPVAASPEIWSFGLRNPWKFTFDNPALGGTGAMLIGDVGQGTREEVNFEPAGQGGRNYGWALREGLIPYPSPPGAAAYLPLTDPIHDYGRASGASITGGYVYRGSRMPSARGRYYFADFISGRVWSFLISGGVAVGIVEHTAELGGSSVLGNISGFGEDAAGELYVLNYTAGTIVAIHPLTAPTGLRVIP